MQAKNATRALRGVLRRVKTALAGRPTPRAKKRDTQDDMRPYQAAYEEWRQHNPARPFRDFAAERIELTLAEGQSHPSLGGNLRGGSEKASARLFRKLVDYGLREQDTCVDYGCGTLRIGQHVINYLGCGRYWGLDITQRLLDEGQALLGPTIMTEKAPHLRIISGDAVAAAGAAKPAMLFSHRVLPHVHPAELQEYFENIMTIIGTSGQAIIDGKWVDGETIEYKPGCWAHEAAALEAVVASLDGDMIVLNEKDRTLAPGHAKSGVFRLVHRSARRALRGSK